MAIRHHGEISLLGVQTEVFHLMRHMLICLLIITLLVYLGMPPPAGLPDNTTATIPFNLTSAANPAKITIHSGLVVNTVTERHHNLDTADRYPGTTTTNNDIKTATTAMHYNAGTYVSNGAVITQGTAGTANYTTYTPAGYSVGTTVSRSPVNKTNPNQISQTVSADTTFQRYYSRLVDVSFDAKGIVSNPAAKNDLKSSVTLNGSLPTLAKTGYQFLGWYETNANGTLGDRVDNSTYVRTLTTTTNRNTAKLTAKWAGPIGAVTTEGIETVSDTSVKFKGTAVLNGLNVGGTSSRFEYGTDPNLTSFSTIGWATPWPVTNNVAAVTSQIAGAGGTSNPALTPNTHYYYRIGVQANPNETIKKGGINSFITKPKIPNWSVHSDPNDATKIIVTCPSFEGNAALNRIGIRYGTDSEAVQNNAVGSDNLWGGSGVATPDFTPNSANGYSFTVTIPNCAENTTYYFKMAANNNTGATGETISAILPYTTPSNITIREEYHNADPLDDAIQYTISDLQPTETIQRASGTAYSRVIPLNQTITVAGTDYEYSGYALNANSHEIDEAHQEINTQAGKLLSEDTTVYRYYHRKIDITFNANGGSGAPGSIRKKSSSSLLLENIAKPTAPQGYQFKGWYTAPTGGIRITDGTGQSQSGYTHARTLPAQNGNTITLYAQWEELHDLTIHYVDGTGSALDPASKVLPAVLSENADYAIDLTTLDEHAGMVPIGWYEGTPQNPAPSQLESLEEAIEDSAINGDKDITIVYMEMVHFVEVPSGLRLEKQDDGKAGITDDISLVLPEPTGIQELPGVAGTQVQVSAANPTVSITSGDDTQAVNVYNEDGQELSTGSTRICTLSTADAASLNKDFSLKSVNRVSQFQYREEYQGTMTFQIASQTGAQP